MMRRLIPRRGVAVRFARGVLLASAVLFAAACAPDSPADDTQATVEVSPSPDAEPPADEPPATGEENTAPATLMKFEEANGFEIYQRYCLVCHGTQGEGDGFNAFNLDPRPRSLVDEFMRTRVSDEDMTEATRLGGRALDKSPLMPPWDKTLSHRQIRYVISYIRLLQQQVRTEAEEEESE